MNWIKVIISEMLKGNFSFLILVIGLLQLIVMIRKGKKDKTMTPQVYENLEQLTYGELLTALDNIREKLYSQGVDTEHADMMYYIALMQELDKRQKEK
jgi:hypothetical protein